MSQRLPNVGGAYYSEEVLNSFVGAKRLAASYGVEEKFLALATPEYLNDPTEQYGLHTYSTLDVQCAHTRITIPHNVQETNALQLLDSGMLWSLPAGLIVVNSPYVLDGDSQDPYACADGFIAHLVCSLAHRIATRKGTAKRIEVRYLETMSLELSRGYDLSQKHTLIFGPVTDYFLHSDLNNAVQFLHAFRHHTRILQTATRDLGALLERIHVNPKHVNYFFNFDVRADAQIAVKQEAHKKLERKEKAIGKRTKKVRELSLD